MSWYVSNRVVCTLASQNFVTFNTNVVKLYYASVQTWVHTTTFPETSHNKRREKLFFDKRSEFCDIYQRKCRKFYDNCEKNVANECNFEKKYCFFV